MCIHLIVDGVEPLCIKDLEVTNCVTLFCKDYVWSVNVGLGTEETSQFRLGVESNLKRVGD
jgi:hypothetical protein